MVATSNKMAAHPGKMALRTIVILLIVHAMTSSAAPVSAPKTSSASNREQPMTELEETNPQLSSDNLLQQLASSATFNQRFQDSRGNIRNPANSRITHSRPADVRGGLNSNYRYDNNAPPPRSFQLSSYVNDQLPKALFRGPGRDPPGYGVVAPGTATVTERSNEMAKFYFDAYDENKKLTKMQERMKIFYRSNPDITPVFRNLEKERKALEKLKKRFVNFKTQRANVAYEKQSGT